MNPRFQNVKAVYFDAGSTLVDEMACYKDRCLRTIALNHLSLPLERFMALLDEGAKKRQNPYQYACAVLGIQQQVPWDFSLETLLPGALEDLKALAPVYAIGIIANQPPHFENRVAAWGVLPYLRFALGSSDIDLYKPDPAIFLYATKKMGIPASESLMIGDRLENDIIPAKSLGFRTIWFRSGVSIHEEIENPSEKADATILSLSEIPALLL